MKRSIYLSGVFVVMMLLALYVRSGRDLTTEPQAGPAVAHSAGGAYSNCLTCHANIRETHKAFGNIENCADCHAQPTPTPHAVEGAYENCLTCHAGIRETHDKMFKEYDNCLKCHEKAS